MPFKESSLNTIRNTELVVLIILSYYRPVDKNFYGTRRYRFFRHQVFYKVHLPINEDTGETFLEQDFQLLLYGSLRRNFQWATDQYLVLFFKSIDIVHHICNGIVLDFFSADGRDGPTNPTKEEFQIIVNLRGGPYRGSGVFGSGFLLNGNGRGHAFDVFHIRLLHSPQKLPGIGVEAFDVHSLAFGKKGVKSQRRLARAGQSRDDDQLVSWNGYTEAFEVIDPGIFDDDILPGI